MLKIVAPTGGDRRFQKVAPAVTDSSRDDLALETLSTPVPFCTSRGEEPPTKAGVLRLVDFYFIHRNVQISTGYQGLET